MVTKNEIAIKLIENPTSSKFIINHLAT
jgi:hypothetical protein